MNQALSRNARSMWWNGHTGNAYCDEVEVVLRATPRIHGITALAEVDYSPRVRLFEVREIEGTWRKLTVDECVSIDGSLRRMAADAREALLYYLPPSRNRFGWLKMLTVVAGVARILRRK